MSVPAAVRSLPMLQALRVRDFRLLWASEAISVIGDQFHYVALSWLVIDLTRSGLALGTILIAIAVPRALLLLPFGVLADRRPPRGLMLVAHVARGVIVGAIAAMALSGAVSLPLLAMLGALFGAADAVYLPARQAFLPRTLDAGRLPSANALLQGTFQLGSIAGMPIAGAAIAVVGTGAAFAVDSVSFLVAAVVVLLISAQGTSRPAVEAAAADAVDGAEPVADAQPAFLAAMGEGFRYVVADRPVLTTMLLALVLNFALNGPASVGMPWLAEVRFDVGPAGLGLMEAAWAVGALAGTLLAGNLRARRPGRVLLGSVLVAGAMMTVVGAAPWFPAVIAALAVMGVTIGYVDIIAISWLQARIETRLVGRVMSLVMLMGVGITPLSLGVAGLLIDLGATALFLGSGALVVVTAVAAFVARFPATFDAASAAGGPPTTAAEPA